MMTKEFEALKKGIGMYEFVAEGEQTVDFRIMQTLSLYQIAVSLDQIAEGLNRLAFKMDTVDQDLKNISRKLK